MPTRSELQRRLFRLLEHPVCSTLRQLSEFHPLHLVGGALRDAALARTPRDLDIVVSGAGRRLASTLATRLGGRKVDLGGDRFAAYRVVTPGARIDIWDRNRATLEQDLARRDFTIHSFAVDLSTAEIADPFDGLGDLAANRLRETRRDVFVADPLRVLRLCRVAAQLQDFRIDDSTLSLAQQAVDALTAVASERLRAELELTLDCEGAATGIQLWYRLGVFPGALLGAPLPEDGGSRLLLGLASTGTAIAHLVAELGRPVDRVLVHWTSMLAVTARFGLIGHGRALNELRQRRLVTRARHRQLERLEAAGGVPAREPGQRWWLHRLGGLWPTALVASLATAATESSPIPVDERLAGIRRLAVDHAGEIFEPRWLLSGEDLVEELGMAEGPELGRILRQLRRRQIEGGLRDREQALELAARLTSEASRP